MGARVEPAEVLGPARPGRSCVMITDTLPCPGAYRLLEGADIAFLEGMFLERDWEAIEGRAHLTIRAAARIASKQGVLRVILTHLSPRYRADQIEELQAEARRLQCGQCEVVGDLDMGHPEPNLSLPVHRDNAVQRAFNDIVQ